MVKKKLKVLFIGDSITDVNRDRNNGSDLGNGYPSLIADTLEINYPNASFDVFNRGISGDKIKDLNERIVQDCLFLKPDVVSILVGVNDTWHNVGNTDFGTVKEATRFKKEYHKFITSLKKAGITSIVLVEPFLLPIPADRKTWRVDLDPKIKGIRELSLEFKTHFLALDDLFNELGEKSAYELYAQDGVHPTELGHQLIADEWLTKIAPQFF